jgi:hypothetical protein
LTQEKRRRSTKMAALLQTALHFDAIPRQGNPLQQEAGGNFSRHTTLT